MFWGAGIMHGDHGLLMHIAYVQYIEGRVSNSTMVQSPGCYTSV